MIQRTLVYSLACMALGAGWELAFLADPVARELLAIFSNASGWISLSSLVLTSLVVGFAFRRWIREWSGSSTVLLGIGLTFVGAAIDVWLTLILNELVREPSTQISLADALRAYAVAPLFGVYFAVTRLYITLPMGLASVFALRAIDRKLRARP